MREFLVLLWAEVIDALSTVVKMTDSLKASMSSSLTSTLSMEAQATILEMLKRRSLVLDEVVELAKLYCKCEHQDLLKSF